MNVLENKVVAMIAVVVGTLILQIPGIAHWYGQVSDEHTHLVTIVEGILGLITILWATRNGRSDTGRKP